MEQFLRAAFAGGTLLAVLSLCACNAADGDRPSAQPTRPPAPQVLTAPETTPYREAIAGPNAGVQWIAPPVAGSEWQPVAGGEGTVSRALQAEAGRLAQIDYTSLSLPDWVTQTRGLKAGPESFNGGALWLDAYGTNGADRWALYGWRGPEFPQKPDRPLVHRWIQVYALVDAAAGRVVRLLATIAGEALE